jgi:hypothetical protein
MYILLAAAIFLLFVPAFTLAEEKKTNILFIFDSSASMTNPISDVESKMEAAKKVLSEVVGDLPANINVGLEVYSHRKVDSCDDIEIVVPVGKLDVDEIRQKIHSLRALGNTPIAAALEKGASELQSLKGKKIIVLISDGEETCDGDPIETADRIRKTMGIDVVIHVTGFDVDNRAKQQLSGIAQAGGGNYYEAKNARQLKQSLVEIKEEAIAVNEQPAILKAINLLAQENGGYVLWSTQDVWMKTNDGEEHKFLIKPVAEAVYAFKYKQTASFDTFTVFVPETDANNLKDFELLSTASDPQIGPFDLIGLFRAENTKFDGSPYQVFKFPRVTARYLKVKLLSNYGQDVLTGLYEFQLLGELTEN